MERGPLSHPHLHPAACSGPCTMWCPPAPSPRTTYEASGPTTRLRTCACPPCRPSALTQPQQPPTTTPATWPRIPSPTRPSGETPFSCWSQPWGEAGAAPRTFLGSDQIRPPANAVLACQVCPAGRSRSGMLCHRHGCCLGPSWPTAVPPCQPGCTWPCCRLARSAAPFSSAQDGRLLLPVGPEVTLLPPPCPRLPAPTAPICHAPAPVRSALPARARTPVPGSAARRENLGPQRREVSRAPGCHGAGSPVPSCPWPGCRAGRDTAGPHLGLLQGEGRGAHCPIPGPGHWGTCLQFPDSLLCPPGCRWMRS